MITGVDEADGRLLESHRAISLFQETRQCDEERTGTMGIRTYKPTSPGRRNSSVSDFAELTDKNKKPEKSLTEPLQKTGGRNNQGFITARHRGGGHKRKYRIIDWVRNDRDGQAAAVTHIEYDPNRSARIALDPVRGWGEAVYPCTRRPGCRHERLERPRGRAQGRQLHSAGEDSDRAHRSTISRCSQAAAASSAARLASARS